MFNIDTNVLTSISVLVTCLCLLFILILQSKLSFKNSFFVKSLMYVILSVGLYYLLLMFSHTTGIIKDDIINTIKNTEKYNGFNDPLHVFLICVLGAIVGFIWYKIDNYVKNKNMDEKR